MNNQSEKKSPWLLHIKKMLSEKNSGQFTANDTSGVPVVLDWKMTAIISPDLAAFKKAVADLAAQTTADMGVQLLQKHPEAASSEYFLKPCMSFFKNGLDGVDWQQVEQTIQATVKQFYLADIASFGDIIKSLLDDGCGFVAIKNQNTQTILGFIMFDITPTLVDGDIKIMHVAVQPAEEHRGLDKLLMSSIFKILPTTKRILIGIRPTQEQALKTYRSWGFVQDNAFTQNSKHNVKKYFAVYEYLADKTNALQQTAATLTMIK